MGKPNVEPDIYPPGEENSYHEDRVAKANAGAGTIKYITGALTLIVTIAGVTAWRTSKNKSENAVPEVAGVESKNEHTRALIDDYEIKGAYFNDDYDYHRDDIAQTGYFTFNAMFEQNGKKMAYNVWVPKGCLLVGPRDDSKQITTISLRGIEKKAGADMVEHALISAPKEDVAKWQSYIANKQNEVTYFQINKKERYIKDTDLEDILEGGWGLRNYDDVLSVMIRSNASSINFEYKWNSDSSERICFECPYVLIYMDPFGIEVKTSDSLKDGEKAIIYLPDGLANLEKIDELGNINEKKRKELMCDDLMDYDLYRIFAKKAIIYTKDDSMAEKIKEGLDRLCDSLKPKRIIPDVK